MIKLNGRHSGRHILDQRTHNVVEAAVDLAHFEIIVNAMLAWSVEPKAPKKSLGRAPELAWPRDELDDDEDEPLVDGADEEDEEPVEPRRNWPGADETAAGDPDDAELEEQAD
jgi:hypothetical protein